MVEMLERLLEREVVKERSRERKDYVALSRPRAKREVHKTLSGPLVRIVDHWIVSLY